jgi:uncharacterized protein (TIGR03000 family)
MRYTPLLALVLILVAPALAGQAPSLPPDRATMVIKLPAEATLSIGSHPTKQTGPERLFESPPLPAGQTFKYVLTASWSENGRLKTATRQILVKAGQRVTVDFLAPEAADANRPARTRSFQFAYEAEITGLTEGKPARVWLPVPSSNDEQDVRIIRTIMPDRAKNRITSEPQDGNQFFYIEAKADAKGSIPISVTYLVTRREVRGESAPSPGGIKLARYLEPDAKVPVGGPALDLIKGQALPADPMARVRAIYDAVNGSMRFSKEGVGWGNGDVVWACENRYGNCTDLHSVFISLVRAQKIPAKFEIGFALPDKRGEGEVTGYHCWAKFRPDGKGWVPVDISEANQNPGMRDYYFGNLTENRVLFSTGRDLELVPRQQAGPLNFFIYPHVEVDGQPYPASKVQRKFTYKDGTDLGR